VTVLALNLGKEAGLTDEQMEMLEYGALLHDIGKIGIRGAVLAKPGKLTEDEYEHIKLHPSIGDNIIAKIDFLKMARSAVRHHHERHDGKGYPDGLKSWQIEISGQIMCIADAFDAMTSSRPYRNAMSTERTLQILKENSGTQFNRELIDIFIGKELYLTNR
ncbi:MAG: HD-GYP domain-containing protein, partial [Desulfobacterales bacterium]